MTGQEMAMGLHGTPEQQERLVRLVERIVERADAIEQLLETVELLATSGLLSGINAVLDEFDETFSAINRPELMGMVANVMMLLGLLSQLLYEPFFPFFCAHAPTVETGADLFGIHGRTTGGGEHEVPFVPNPRRTSSQSLFALPSAMTAERSAQGHRNPKEKS